MNITHTHRIELPREVQEYIRSIACQLDCLPQNLQEMENRIMSKISEFEARERQRHAATDAGLEGIKADIVALNAKIQELQNSPGAITPEDQALLDGIETSSTALVEKVQGVDAQQ